MALGLKTLRGSGTAVMDLDAQQAELDAAKAANASAAMLEQRKQWAAERKQAVLGDDQTGHKLAAQIKADEEKLKASRAAWNHWNGTRMAAGIVAGEKHKTLTRNLISTAPAEIDEAVAMLDRQMSDARSGRRSDNRFDDASKSVQWISNNKSVDAFLRAAEAAKLALADLKLEPLDIPELKKAIAKILKALPKLDFTLKLVDSAAVKS